MVMTDADVMVGYCTNVHAGAGFDAMLGNLETHALAVKRAVSADRPMGVGLWLSQEAARQTLAGGGLDRLRSFLGEHGLVAFTFNGFPQGDFHQPIVKHRVYEPDWSTQARYDYTLDLARILAALTPEGHEAGISTLPLGWPGEPCQPWSMDAAGAQLLRLAQALDDLHQQTGRLIHVDLEPEPLCALDRSEHVADFFTQHLLGRGHDAVVLRHLRVCHDICHAAVMFEDQPDMFDRYRRMGIRIGKVQVSSAVELRWSMLDETQRDQALAQLATFAEDRYLHQTVVKRHDGSTRCFEDLPLALPRLKQIDDVHAVRIHFHVPLYLESFGHLHTTQVLIRECLDLLEPGDGVKAFEAETYAWTVLPAELCVAQLADGIARELRWLRGEMQP